MRKALATLLCVALTLAVFPAPAGAQVDRNLTQDAGVSVYQSSVQQPAERAIDQQISYDDSGTWTQTANKGEPWLEIDLGEVRSVTSVVVHARSYATNVLYADVDPMPGAQDVSAAEMDAHGPVFESSTFATAAGAGTLITVDADVRYIRVADHDGPFKLRLAEVEVLGHDVASIPDLGCTNIAVGGAATSNGAANGGVPALAVDGVTNGDFWAGSVALMPATSVGGWWQIDLGAFYDLTKVRVHGRTDVTTYDEYYLFFSDDELPADVDADDTFAQTLANTAIFADVYPAPYSDYDLTTTSRWLRIHRRGADGLALAEVEICGTLADDQTGGGGGEGGTDGELRIVVFEQDPAAVAAANDWSPMASVLIAGAGGSALLFVGLRVAFDGGKRALEVIAWRP